MYFNGEVHCTCNWFILCTGWLMCTFQALLKQPFVCLLVCCLFVCLFVCFQAVFPVCFNVHTQIISTLSEGKLQLAEQMMNNMLGRQVDANYVVRMYCIRGLGNMADIGGSQVQMKEEEEEEEEEIH